MQYRGIARCIVNTRRFPAFLHGHGGTRSPRTVEAVLSVDRSRLDRRDLGLRRQTRVDQSLSVPLVVPHSP